VIELSHVEAVRKLADIVLGGRSEEKAKRHIRQSHILRNILTRLYDKIDNSDIRLIRDSMRYCLGAYRFSKMYLKRKKASLPGRKKKTSLPGRDWIYQQFRNEVLGFINGRFKSPQFLWIHTIINHIPYYLPPDNSSEFDVGEINCLNSRGVSQFVNVGTCGKLKTLYIESMKTTDSFIGDIIEALRAKGLLDNSIIIITADHGEEFMEEGYYGHNPYSSSDRLLHVPLIFWCPKIIQSKTVSVPVCTLDILATVCDLLGMRIPESSRGLSLKEVLLGPTEDSREWEEFRQRPLFSEAWRTASMFDRNPGSSSNRKVFTVRKGSYRLKVDQQQKTANTILERLELVNWISNERLDAGSNTQVLEHLKCLLHEHMYNEEVFASHISNEAEKQRVRGALNKMRSKL